MATFSQYANSDGVLRDQHNNLVNQLNKGVGSSGTVLSTGAFTTGNFIMSNSTDGTSIKDSGYNSASFVRSTTISYAEGDWSPSIYGATVPGTITMNGLGKYTRFGRVCQISYTGNVTAISGTTGSCYIGPLPYQPTTVIGQSVFCVLSNVNFTLTLPYLSLPVTSTGQGVFRCYSTASNVAINVDRLTTASAISVHGTYLIST